MTYAATTAVAPARFTAAVPRSKFEEPPPVRIIARSTAAAMPAPRTVALPVPDVAAVTIDCARPGGSADAWAARTDAASTVATAAAADPFRAIRVRRRASARLTRFLAPSRERPRTSPIWRT